MNPFFWFWHSVFSLRNYSFLFRHLSSFLASLPFFFTFFYSVDSFPLFASLFPPDLSSPVSPHSAAPRLLFFRSVLLFPLSLFLILLLIFLSPFPSPFSPLSLSSPFSICPTGQSCSSKPDYICHTVSWGPPIRANRS